MEKNIKGRNVKAMIPLPIKGDWKTEQAVKNRPNLKPKNKRAKVRV
jgi:hypothetical protein